MIAHTSYFDRLHFVAFPVSVSPQRRCAAFCHCPHVSFETVVLRKVRHADASATHKCHLVMRARTNCIAEVNHTVEKDEIATVMMRQK